MRTLVLAASLALAAPAAADPPLTLRWHGQSFITLTTPKGTRVALDPHGIDAYGRPVTSADLVVLSHDHTDHANLDAIENRAKAKVIAGWKKTGTTEGGRPRTTWNIVDETVADVRVRTVPSYHDDEQGLKRGINTILVLEIAGRTIVHLGDLGHTLNDEQLKRIGPVDVLLIPAGGVYTLSGSDAKKVIAQLKPKLFVVPIHYGTRVFDDLLGLDEFLDGNPLAVEKRDTTNELSVPADLKADAPKIVILGWEKAK